MAEPMVSLATAVASKAVTTALEPFIRQLLDIQETQSQSLARLEDDVRALMNAPWRESKLHLKAAESAGSSDPVRRDAELAKAKDALLRAYSAHSRPSVVRALIAGDTATLEAMLGRPGDARSWAATAHADIVSYMRDEAARVQSAINHRPSWPVRLRQVIDLSFWDEVLGSFQNEPEPASRAEGSSITARIAQNTNLKRALLEMGPDAPPGWRHFPRSDLPEYTQWERTGVDVGGVLFSPTGLPLVGAVIELHRAAAQADDLRRVANEFGCRDLPIGRLKARFRSRYNAVIEYVNDQEEGQTSWHP